MKYTIYKTVLTLSACSLLAACASTPTPRQASMDRAVANSSRTQAVSSQSLAVLEQKYKQKGTAENALKYAHALRHEGYYNRAALILSPYATDEGISDTDVIIEYAMIQSAMGNYMEAEDTARRAVVLAPNSGQAYHVLGIALDAQGHHQQAQTAFDKGLENWEGDPSPILNNIGLNLAALGFLDEAIETLRKALDTAPDRQEIERNLRIVTALQYQPPREGLRAVPRPPRKPAKSDDRAEVTIEDKIEPAAGAEKNKAVTVKAAKVEDVEAAELEE